MKRATMYFRVGVGAVILDGAYRVLVCERSTILGAWQFPQGGLENNEGPVQALFREIYEETGIPRTSLRLIGRYPDLLAYELPRKAQSIKTGMGQVQYWFFLQLRTPSLVIRLPPNSEFTAFRWTSFNSAVRRVVSFKRPLYRRLQQHFNLIARHQSATRR